MRKKAAILLVFCLVLFLAHKIENLKVIAEDQNITFDDDGIGLTTMPPKTSKRVVFIGNSVFQLTRVIPQINKMKGSAGLDFETGNFAYTGQTIGDELVTYNYIKKFHPDLLVVQLHSTSFGFSYPFYRSVSKKLVFLPEMRGMWHPLIFKTFEKNEFADSILYSYFPVYRMLPVYRARLKLQLEKSLSKWCKLPIMDNFQFSLVPWENHELLKITIKSGSLEFPLSKDFMKFFIDQLEADHQKTVFIMQETAFQTLPIMEEMASFFKGKKHCFLYDFRRFYNEKEFTDTVHPSEEGSKQAAIRILLAIKKHLD